jgi:pyruvate formate lyase activating enzyme
LHIKALLPASLIEYPEHIADVVYVGECNFRCPYCYNVDLVLHADRLPDIDAGRVLMRLEERRGFIDGLAVTGGEPSLQEDLRAFLSKVRGLGVDIKLDTNGYRPDVLQELLQQHLVDYVAMDIKSRLRGYSVAAGVRVDMARIEKSVQLLVASDVDYEFRTTVVPRLTTMEDIRGIAALIDGAKRFALQCFRPGETVGWGLGGPADVPSAELMQAMMSVVAPHVEQTSIRGLGQPSPVQR